MVLLLSHSPHVTGQQRDFRVDREERLAFSVDFSHNRSFQSGYFFEYN